MASLAPAPLFDPQPAEEGIFTQTNNLWQATPRTTRSQQDLELLMAAQQIRPQGSSPAPQAARDAQRGATIATPTLRAPTCTHTTMNRLYGAHICGMCGKVPSLGWLYSCEQPYLELLDIVHSLTSSAGQQDQLPRHQHSISDTEALPVVSDDEDYFQAQAKIAESLGMSRSVVHQMRTAQYTFDQMEALLQQRRHVLEVIKQAENPSARSTPVQDTSKSLPQGAADSIIASVGATVTPLPIMRNNTLSPSTAGTPANIPAGSTSTSPSKVKKAKRFVCRYQVCHACRPLLQDRLAMSFEPVLNDEVLPLTESETKKLPMRHPDIVRDIGTRQPPPTVASTESQDVTNAPLHQNDGYEDESRTWTPTTATSSAYYRDDDEESFSHQVSPVWPIPEEENPCSSPVNLDAFEHFYRRPHTPYPPAGGRMHHTHGSITVDTGRSSSTGSSASSTEQKIEPLTPSTPGSLAFELELSNKLRKAKGSGTGHGVYDDENGDKGGRPASRSSSIGNEVEVEGGVALTEEVVESGRPDFATE